MLCLYVCVIGALELSRYIIVWLLNNSCLICVTILVIYVFLNLDHIRSSMELGDSSYFQYRKGTVFLIYLNSHILIRL